MCVDRKSQLSANPVSSAIQVNCSNIKSTEASEKMIFLQRSSCPRRSDLHMVDSSSVSPGGGGTEGG